MISSKRIPFNSIVLIIFLITVVLVSWIPLEKGELSGALSKIGIYPLHVPYGDFISVAAGMKVAGEGGDPYLNNYYDDMGRAFNYPPIWLKAPFLNGNREYVRYVYLVFALTCCVGIGLLFWDDQHRKVWLYLPFLLSPPVILGFERCNIDIFVFGIVSLAYFILREGAKNGASIVAGILLCAATVLKVFPVFAFFGFLRGSWKRSFVYLVPFAIFSGLYFLSIRPELALIQKNTPLNPFFSYGISIFPANVFIRLPAESSMELPMLLLIAWVIFSLLVAFSYFYGKGDFRKIEESEEHALLLFRLGAFIYMATFLLGANYDYRLIFLLFTLPFAFGRALKGEKESMFYYSYLAAFLVLFWSQDMHGTPFIFGNEIASWIVLFLTLIVQFRYAPDFIRSLIYPNQVKL